MKSYIKAELYKQIKHPYIFIATIIISVLSIIGATIIKCTPQLSNTFIGSRYGILSSGVIFSIGINIILMIFLPIIAEDFRNSTFKNLVTTNLSKGNVLMGKFIVQLILAFVAACILSIALAISIQILPSGEGYESSMLVGFYIKLLFAFPCFAASIELIDILAICIRKELMICLAYYYGYIQFYAITSFMSLKISNPIVRFVIMPGQVGYMFNTDFDLVSCAVTALSGMLYIIILGYYSTNKIRETNLY